MASYAAITALADTYSNDRPEDWNLFACKMKLIAIVTFLIGVVAPSPPPITHISQVESNKEATPARELVQTRRLGRFIVRHVSKEPVALLSADFSKAHQELILEFQNVSTAPIKSVEYSISRHEKCAEYMYAFTASPRMIYGDERRELPVSPKMLGRLRVTRSKELTDLLNPKTYVSCGADKRSPILMLSEVSFVDGSVWRPYAKPF